MSSVNGGECSWDEEETGLQIDDEWIAVEVKTILI